MNPREFGPGSHAQEAFVLFPFLAALVLLLAVLTVAGLHLVRSGAGQLGPSPRPRPEAEAERVLAERFARGDIDGEEFLERSSLLGWTPGVQQLRAPRRLRRRRG